MSWPNNSRPYLQIDCHNSNVSERIIEDERKDTHKRKNSNQLQTDNMLTISRENLIIVKG